MSDPIQNFELILKKQCGKRLSLYSANKQQNKHTFQPQDVISSVSMQLKAYQVADSFKSEKCVKMSLQEKSKFLSVSRLPVYNEMPKQPSKFDTQCVSNSELINLIDDAEIIDGQRGITQEFETSFLHHTEKQNIEVEDKIDLNVNICDKENVCKDIETVSNKCLDNIQDKVDRVCKIGGVNEDLLVNSTENNHSISIISSLISGNNIRDEETDFFKSQHNKDIENKQGKFSQILNKCIEIEDDISIDDLAVERPISPIFMPKNVKTKSNTPSPLTFNLDRFEQFERIAIPIVEANDLKTAKHVINSQILDKELHIKMAKEIFINERDIHSPALQTINSKEIQVPIIDNKTEFKSYEVKDPDLDVNLEFMELDKATSDNLINKVLKKKSESNVIFKTESEILKDEILFSSDEEDCAHKYYQDLPFTCALETSFYDKSGVLDKTMYVGFQTASNKSIQIFTESFAQAQNLLSAVSSDKVTVTDLVNNCDTYVNIKSQNVDVKPVDYKDKEKETNLVQKHNKETELEVATENPFDMSNKDSRNEHIHAINKTVSQESNDLKEATKRNFEGFMTANNKEIKLSDKALARCRKVFQNIDFTENFDTQIDNTKIETNDENCKDETVIVNKKTVDDEIQNIDDVIIQEFENIEMSLEEDKGTDRNLAPNEFNTARNKDNKISATSVSNLKDIIKDIDFDEDLTEADVNNSNLKGNFLQNKNISESVVGFRTASNKNINISKEALAKTNKIFQDIDSVELPIKSDKSLEKIKNNFSDFEQPSTSKASFVGFKTANNKDIKISEQALAKTKIIFNDIDATDFVYKKDLQNTREEEESNSNLPSVSKTNFVGFKTASNKNINISKKALDKTDNIFKDIDYVEFKFPKKHSNDLKDQNISEGTEVLKYFNQPSTSKQQFVGFRTANNKEVKISGTALAKTRNIFKDIDSTEEDETINEAIQLETNEPLTAKLNFVGFKTANNRKIEISDIALAKTKNIFEDIDSKDFKFPIKLNKGKEYPEQTQEENKVKMKDLHQPCTNTGSVSFKTANNRKLHISKEALAKTDSNFKDIGSEEFMSLATASTNSEMINLVERKNKQLDENAKCQPEMIDLFQPSEGKSTFVGFQTANNRKINITKESLAKTKSIFKDIDSNNSIFSNKLNGELQEKEGKSIYPDMNEFEQPSNIGCNSVFVGFKTANNKVISISEAALAKTKNIFKDLESTDIDSHKKLKDDYPNIIEIYDSKIKSNLKHKDIFNMKETKLIENDLLETSAPKFEGFQTASNKQVTVSANALIESRIIFNDIDVTDKFNTESKYLKDKEYSNKVNNLADICKITLDRNKEISGDVHVSDTDDFAVGGKTSPVFKGFQTANKIPVPVSKEALAKSKKIFQDIELMPDDEPETEFHGFKTANDKLGKVSEKACPETKKNFHDADKNSMSFKEFQTASNKKVFVAEDALAESKKIFQDIDSDNEKTEKLPKTEEKISSNIKFRFTNSGVIISDEATARYKRRLSDIDDANDNITKNKKGVVNIEENISNIINTQVLNNFDESLHTDDFHDTPIKSKRSGSPILSCPRAKKRKKFEIPYSQKLPKPELKTEIVNTNVNKIIFDDNYKKNKKYTLNDLTTASEKNNSVVDPYLLQFNFNNLLQFQFHDNRNGLSYGNMTIDLLKELFLNSVNSKLIPNGWMDNHLKLILWKLISYEIKYKSAVVCSARNVVDQLKYRYDKELYNAQRPALRKILEKDDVASKTIVLCVAGFFVDGVNVASVTTTNNVEILLTDGWYCIRACVDKMLAQLVCNGKIGVGIKIVTNGAELVNCEQGVSPWEDTSAVRLKIFGNSTRRARWNARLGYHGNGAILSQLSSVKLDGGKVSKLRVFVTRVYPAMYVEKFEDGSTVTRSERLEHLHQIKSETERQAVMEKIYEEVEREFSDQESQDSDGLSDASVKRSCLDSGSQIAKVMKRSKDPAEFRAGLTSSQSRLLEAHTCKSRERLLENIQKRISEKIEKAGVCVNRNVVTLLKIRVAGVVDKSGVEITKGMMSIWKPSDAILEIIKEGAWIDVMNVLPTAVRYSEIQISAGRQSVFSISKYTEPEKFKPYTKLLKRNCFTIKDLAQNPSMSTDYNEIDTVGFIFLIDPSVKAFDSTKQSFQNVYLADTNKNMICINFWGGLNKFGFQNVLDTGQIVACANLQKRAGNTRKTIPQYRVTEFSYFTKTPKNENARSVVDDLNKKFLSLDRRKFCEDCVVLKSNYSVIKNNNENVSPYRFNNSDCNISKNKMFIDSPLVTPNRINDNFNLTGLDFESTFKQTDIQNLPEEVLLRKKKVNEKIARLKMYGEPPPLSNIHIINKSKNATNPYKSPLLSSNNNAKNSLITNDDSKKQFHSKSDSFINVASVKDTPEKCANLNESSVICSPVLMNRTYVKNVNPVKINFDMKDNNDSHFDHFAEEFDESPPLSLD